MIEFFCVSIANLDSSMETFLFRCPQTLGLVQGEIKNSASDEAGYSMLATLEFGLPGSTMDSLGG